MLSVFFVGKMVDGTEFTSEVDARTVINAITLELIGNDRRTDDFIINKFDTTSAIAVNAMIHESEAFMKAMIRLIKTGGRFAIHGAVTSFGVSCDVSEAETAFIKGEF